MELKWLHGGARTVQHQSVIFQSPFPEDDPVVVCTGELHAQYGPLSWVPGAANSLLELSSHIEPVEQFTQWEEVVVE